jgi:hypothetical protein
VEQGGDIPEAVRRFLVEHIDSVSLLDALLLIRATPEKRWTPAELGRALVTGERLAATQLRTLRDHRLVRDEDGAFRYAPAASEGGTIDALAECYARRRHTVIGLIYGSPTRGATSLADAFRLRRD